MQKHFLVLLSVFVLAFSSFSAAETTIALSDVQSEISVNEGGSSTMVFKVKNTGTTDITAKVQSTAGNAPFSVSFSVGGQQVTQFSIPKGVEVPVEMKVTGNEVPASSSATTTVSITDAH